MKINQQALKFMFDETLYKQANTFKIEGEEEHQFLGKNQRNILVVVPKQENILNDGEKVFFEKILNSIGLQLDDVAVICPKNEAKFVYYKRTFECQQVITFGVRPFEIGIEEIEVPLYEIKDFQNIPILYGNTLKTIQGDVDKKKALWLNLKKIFT